MILHGPWLKRKEHIFEVELNEDYDEKDQFKDNNAFVQGHKGSSAREVSWRFVHKEMAFKISK